MERWTGLQEGGEVEGTAGRWRGGGDCRKVERWRGLQEGGEVEGTAGFGAS